MLLISVGNSHLLSPVVVEVVIVISLDGLLLIDLLESVEWRLVVHGIAGIGQRLRH